MSREYDIAYGRHSLIPECCIRYFVHAWEREYENRTPYWFAVFHSRFDYVPCSTCFAHDNKVNIRICKRDCGKQCRKEFK